MPALKCKMCGGDLEIAQDTQICTCQYCGSTMTLPRLDDERRTALYDRASQFRQGSEFDRAMGVYESILTEDRTDAEAYWSLVLCKYGVVYVEDPESRRRVPTCSRAQLTPIFADADYQTGLSYASAAAREIYIAQARQIDAIQQGILAVSAKEEPFDVFISYKETDEFTGGRTPDSVIGQELYDELEEDGYKVFFSRVTLENALGSAYEPTIFAALQSARVMVVIGTKPEYFNATWVKNEWGRYLALIREGADKTLVPVFRNMSGYDLPPEFAHLQAQDMGKLGAMQDLVRGIRKLVPREAPASTAAPVHTAEIAPMLRRAYMCLGDADYDKAAEILDDVLNRDPENVRAYVGLLMAELHVRREEDLTSAPKELTEYGHFRHAYRFADEDYRKVLYTYNEQVVQGIQNRDLEKRYRQALRKKSEARNELGYRQAAALFFQLGEYKDSAQHAKGCRILADRAHEAEAAAVFTVPVQVQQQFQQAQDAISNSQLYQSIRNKNGGNNGGN